MKQIIYLVVEYVFGLSQIGFIYDKSRRVDIRQHGSDNSESTNTLHVMGVKAGLIVFMGNFLKTVIPCFLVKILFRSQSGYIYALMLCTGLGVILDHNFPLYLRFESGKGAAATAGIMFSPDQRPTAVCLLVFVFIVAVTRYVSLGSLVVSAISPYWNIYLGHLGAYGSALKAGSQSCAVSAVIAAITF